MVFKGDNKCLKNDNVAEATFDLQLDNVNSIIVFIQIFIKFLLILLQVSLTKL